MSSLGSSTGDNTGKTQPTTDMKSSQHEETVPGGVGWMTMASTLLRAKRAWRALVDNSTGSTYYFDETTGVSQWEKPSDMNEKSGVPHSQGRATEAVVNQRKAAKSEGDTAASHPAVDPLSATTVTVPGSTHSVETRLEGEQGSEEPSKLVGNATLAEIPAQHSEGDSDPNRQRVLADEINTSVDTSNENKIFAEGISTRHHNESAVADVGESPYYGAARVDLARPSSAHGNRLPQESRGLGQKHPLQSPATIFTAWQTPKSQERDGVEGFIEPKGVQPVSEFDHGGHAGAGVGDNTRHLLDLPSSRQEDDTGSAQVTIHEEEGGGEGKGKGESKDKASNWNEQELHIKQSDSGEGGSSCARDGIHTTQEIFDLSDKLQIAVTTCENQDPSPPRLNAPQTDRKYQQNANADDASLPRVESSSTLSTDAGGLDFLAQYVTGHSSTLDRGVVVEPPMTWTREEDHMNGGDDLPAIDTSVDGKPSPRDSPTSSMAEKHSTETTPQLENKESTETVSLSPCLELIQDGDSSVKPIVPTISRILQDKGEETIEPHPPLQVEYPTVAAQPIPSSKNAGEDSSAQTSGQQQPTVSLSEHERAESIFDVSSASSEDTSEKSATPTWSALDVAREGGRQAGTKNPVSSLLVGHLESDGDKPVPQPLRQEAYKGSSTRTSTINQQVKPMPSKDDEVHRKSELSPETRPHTRENPCAVAAPILELRGEIDEVTGEQPPRPLQRASSTESKGRIADEVERGHTISVSTMGAYSQDIEKGTPNVIIPTNDSIIAPPDTTWRMHAATVPIVSEYDATLGARVETAIIAEEPDDSRVSKSCAIESSSHQPFEAVRDATVVEATVKIQAHVRGWAARQLCARIVARRETMGREAWDAQQRAAAVIQSVARGHLARREQQKVPEMEALLDQHNTGHTSMQERGGTMDIVIDDDDTQFVSFRSHQSKQSSSTAKAAPVEGSGHETYASVASQALSDHRVDGSSGRGTEALIDGGRKVISECQNVVDNRYRRNDEGCDNEDAYTIPSESTRGVLQGEQPSHDNEKRGEGHNWMTNVEHGWMETMSLLETIIEEDDSQKKQNFESRFGNEHVEEGPSNVPTEHGNEVVLYTEVPTVGLPGVEPSAGVGETYACEEWAGDTDEANEAYPTSRRYDSSTSSSSEDVGSSSELTGPDVSRESSSVFSRSPQSGLASDPDHENAVNPRGNNNEEDDVLQRTEANHLNRGTDEMWKVYLDATAPLQTLEALRSNVVEQAEAAARITMTAIKTDASRREAARIRELAARQDQAAANFREAIRHSIAVDCYRAPLTGAPKCDNNHYHGPCRSNGSGANVVREGSDNVGDDGFRWATSKNGETPEGAPMDNSRGFHDNEGAFAHTNQKITHSGVEVSPYSGLLDRTKYHQRTRDGADQTALNKRHAGATAYGLTTGFDRPIIAWATRELTSDLSRLSSRQYKAPYELLLQEEDGEGCREIGNNLPKAVRRKDEVVAAIGQSVGLQAQVVGLMEEVVTRTLQSRLDARAVAHAACKWEIGHLAVSIAADVQLVAARHHHVATAIEAATDPLAARHVADDISRLTLEQEKLILQVQSLTASAAAVECQCIQEGGGLDGKGEGEAGVGDANGANEAVGGAAGELHERLHKHAVFVVQELQKGAHTGNIAAARAQAIRSVGQATKLADELRHIASSQETASSALDVIGAQLVAESLTESPLPISVVLPSTEDVCHSVVEEVNAHSGNTDNMMSSTGTVNELKNGRRIVFANNTSDVADGGWEKDNTTAAGDRVRRISIDKETSAIAAVEMAAGKEETAAAVRIQAFLRRRRRDKLTTVSGEEALPVTKMMSPGSAIDGEQGRGCDGWFGAAVRYLHQAVNAFLLGDTGTGSADRVPSVTAKSLNNEPHSAGEKRTETDNDNDHADTNTIDSDSEDSDDDSCCWSTFPPVPLRARAPSLYTLPAPSGYSRGLKNTRGAELGGGGPTTSARVFSGRNSVTGVSTKLDPDVSARLSTARSVFALCATDVLVAFSPSLPPPPPPPTHLESTINFTLTIPGTSPSKNSRRRRLSPEGLRKRLRTEAEDAGRAALGRPWGSSSPGHVAASRGDVAPDYQPSLAVPQPEQGKNASRYKNTDSVGGERRQQSNTSTRRLSPSFARAIPTITALGKRLLAQRVLAQRAARRRRLLGKVDGFRARHVGRQLRIEASADALERMHRTLNRQMSIAREESNVSIRHMQQLLGFTDRFVFSDSQLCMYDIGVVSKGSAGQATATEDGVRHQSTKEELLDDLHQKFPVVREQPRCGDDADPICCDQLQRAPQDDATTRLEDTEKVVVHHDMLDTGMAEREDSSAYSDSDVLASKDNHCDELRGARGDSSDCATPVISEKGRSKLPMCTGVSKENVSASPAVGLPLGRAVKGGPGWAIRKRGGDRATPPPKKTDAVAAEFSTHLHGVDKYPSELARLCRFAEFLTKNSLMSEAYEVILHAISSSKVSASSNNSININTTEVIVPVPFPILIPSGLGAQLRLVAGRLALSIGRYSEAIKHVKAAVRTVTVNVTSRSSAMLVASSRFFEFLLDDRSAEILLLGSLVLQPDYQPVLASYGRLAARQGELDVAERYLTRAASVSRKSTSEEGTAGIQSQQASDWIVLMEFLLEKRPPSRSADAAACFRRALACTNWKPPELGATAMASSASLPSPTGKVFATSHQTTEKSAPSPSGAELQPTAEDLLALGRFELLRNRSFKRALTFFKGCLTKYPWHASAKVHVACCLLGLLGPARGGRTPSRAVLRIDALFRSALNCHEKKHCSTSPTTSVGPPGKVQNRQHISKQATHPVGGMTGKHRGLASPPLAHHGAWLLWGLYAKFAERCLDSLPLAVHALEQAGRAALSRTLEREIPSRRCLTLVARAQFYQRWPGLKGITGRSDNAVVEGMFVEVTRRYPGDPKAHTALGHFLLAKDGDTTTVDDSESAAVAFRRARSASSNKGGALFSSIAATRGLAVALRRQYLSARQLANDSPNNDDIGDPKGPPNEKRNEEDPRDLLLGALEAAPSMPHGRESVALLRTAAMHLFAWRGTVDQIITVSAKLPVFSGTAMMAATRAGGEREAERLLARAVELEPFHVPTLAALAFVLLQQHGVGSGRGTLKRAEGLLEKAVKFSGRSAPADVLRALALVRGSQGCHSWAVSLFRRAVDSSSRKCGKDRGGVCRGDDVPSLCGLAQLLLTPRVFRRPPPLPLSAPPPLDGPTTGYGGVRGLHCGAVHGPEMESDTSRTISKTPNTKPAIISKSFAKCVVTTVPSTVVQSEEVALLLPPSDEDRDEAARLLARAVTVAGGAMPTEGAYLGGGGDGRFIEEGGTEGGDKRGVGEGVEVVQRTLLADVHLAVSGFSLQDQGGQSDGGGGGSDCGDREWHLQQAARAAPDTKTWLTARYLLGKRALAAGNDMKAELLFLAVLDAEPVTYGACATLLSILRQISIDIVQAKGRLKHLRRRSRRKQGRRGGTGGVTKETTVSSRLSQKLKVARRSLKLLERLEVYASLRTRYAGERLRGPGLTSLEWALALEEGWEERYTRLLEGGDGWEAMAALC